MKATTAEVDGLFDCSDEHLDKIQRVFSSHLTYDSPDPVIDAPLLILAFTNRCGSNLLGEYLKSTELFSGFDEHLNSENIDFFLDRFQIPSFPDFIKLLWSFTWPGRLYGVKAAWSQVLALKKYNIDKMFAGGIRVIHMERYDVLAQAVSMSIAVQTEQWVSSDEPKTTASQYDEALIRHYLDYIGTGNARIRELISLTRADHIHVTYENVVSNPASEVARITDWLSLPRGTVTEKPVLQRQATTRNDIFADRYARSFWQKFSEQLERAA